MSGNILNQTVPQLSGEPRKPITLLHTSDLHLGHTSNALKAQAAFDSVLNSAQSHKADILIIAGDLFDTSKVSPDTADYVFQSLGNLKRPVVVLPGNHDIFLTSPETPFRYDQLPDNVHVIMAAAGELINLDSLNLSVWGRPVHNHGPAFRPLEGLPTRPNGSWYIAIAHGLVVDSNADPAWSLPIPVNDLANADCDYIALGHMDDFEDVTQGSARACYSGAPWGTRQPVVALVHLDQAHGVQVEPIPLP